MLIADTNEKVLNFFNKCSEIYYVEFIYLHGELQRLCEYDTFSVTTKKEYEKFMESTEDIFDIKVCISNKIENEDVTLVDATAYVWRNENTRRGLVVLKSDKASNEFAMKKFTEKAKFL